MAAEREELRIVDDQMGAPTWSRAIATATRQIILLMAAEPELHGGERIAEKLAGRHGLCDLTAGEVSPDMASRQRIVEERLPKQPRWARLIPISAIQYPVPAPAAELQGWGERLRQTFGVALPMWRESLAAVIADIGEQYEWMHRERPGATGFRSGSVVD